MIHVTVCYGKNFTNIEFPCSERYLQSKLMEIGMSEAYESELFIEKVKQPEYMFELENMFINLDELNYLAKRLDSFGRNEMMQFNAVAKQYDMKEMKELINLTFNLQRYTLLISCINV